MSKTRREVNKFFHGPVDMGHGNSADYVAAHGERQIQRGKKPSVVPYDGETNPRKAFERAQLALRERALWDGPDASCIGRVAIINFHGREVVLEKVRGYGKDFINRGAVGATFTTAPPSNQGDGLPHGAFEITFPSLTEVQPPAVN